MRWVGETTSHLAGMFNRTVRMIECGLQPVYVFDGKPPTLKVKAPLSMCSFYFRVIDIVFEANIRMILNRAVNSHVVQDKRRRQSKSYERPKKPEIRKQWPST